MRDAVEWLPFVLALVSFLGFTQGSARVGWGCIVAAYAVAWWVR